MFPLVNSIGMDEDQLAVAPMTPPESVNVVARVPAAFSKCHQSRHRAYTRHAHRRRSAGTERAAAAKLNGSTNQCPAGQIKCPCTAGTGRRMIDVKRVAAQIEVPAFHRERAFAI